MKSLFQLKNTTARRVHFSTFEPEKKSFLNNVHRSVDDTHFEFVHIIKGHFNLLIRFTITFNLGNILLINNNVRAVRVTSVQQTEMAPILLPLPKTRFD